MAKRSNEAARFKTAGRGYARAEVEKAIAKYEQMLDEASRRIAQLEIDIDKAKESEAAAIDQAFFSLLEVKDRILGSAETRAQAILEEARDRAGAVDTHSGAKPSAILENAQRQAEELLAAAKSEAAVIQQQADTSITFEQEPDEIVRAAHEQADQIRSAAQGEVDQARLTAATNSAARCATEG